MGEKQVLGASFGRNGVAFRRFSRNTDRKLTEKTRPSPNYATASLS